MRPRAVVVVAAVAALGACGAPVAGPVAGPVAASCSADAVVVLASQADIARFAGCASARGVTVRSGAALDVSALRALTAITGDLVIGPTVAVDEASFAALRSVDGAIRVVGNGLLQGLYLPRLERAGRIDIDGNAALTAISLPRLQAVHGALRITGNGRLAHVELSALASIDRELVVSGVPGLALLDAAQLQRAAAVELDAPGLPPDVADRLRAAAAAR